MPCTPFSLPNGARGFICTSRLRPRCACGAPPTLQCDAPTRRSTGTCDRYICASCAIEITPDVHLCQAHADRSPADVLPAPNPQQSFDFQR